MIYTFYTDTHKQFLDNWFMNTIHEKDKVHVEKFDQECPSGSFMEEGWNRAMLDKVNYIRECLTKNELFFHLDCDIQFFDSFYDDYIELLEKNNLDLLAQHDGNGTVCCGFMLIRPSDKMRTFWDEVYEMTENNFFGGNGSNDQLACNYLLRRKEVKAGLLGSECFSIWMTNGMRVWEPSHGVSDLPENIKIHHGNYTAGIKNKLDLMSRVRNYYEPQS